MIRAGPSEVTPGAKLHATDWISSRTRARRKRSDQVDVSCHDPTAKLRERLLWARARATTACEGYFAATASTTTSYWQQRVEELRSRQNADVKEVHLTYPVLVEEGDVRESAPQVFFCDGDMHFVKVSGKCDHSHLRRIPLEDARAALKAVVERHEQEIDDIERRKERADRALKQANLLEESRLARHFQIAFDQISHVDNLKTQCLESDASKLLHESFKAAIARAEASVANLIAYSPATEQQHLLYELLQAPETKSLLPARSCDFRRLDAKAQGSRAGSSHGEDLSAPVCGLRGLRLQRRPWIASTAPCPVARRGSARAQPPDAVIATRVTERGMPAPEGNIQVLDPL